MADALEIIVKDKLKWSLKPSDKKKHLYLYIEKRYKQLEKEAMTRLKKQQKQAKEETKDQKESKPRPPDVKATSAEKKKPAKNLEVPHVSKDVNTTEKKTLTLRS